MSIRYDFLREFPRRMKVVGMYSVLLSNSSQKQIWKRFYFESDDEQINLLFSVMLFIMEQSLKEEICTIEEIGLFINDINNRYYKKDISYDDCETLSEFIVNTVLSNGGLQMKFKGFNYENSQYKDINISYVANKIVYEDNKIKRTSYYLTENGYSLLLGTLEVENNMRLTIQEIIFNEHLKKRNFDKALDDIKNIFELMRIEKLKNDEAIARIRQNILNFSVDEYGERIDASFSTINSSREKLLKYKEIVNNKVSMIENEHIDLDHLKENDQEKIDKLREISIYLDKTIDCHIDIMKSYNTYRDICMQEMENYLKISQVERFSFSQNIFEKILDDPMVLNSMDLFLRPLFNKNPGKVFTLGKVFLPQRKREARGDGKNIERSDTDEKKWIAEKKKQKEEKLEKYITCVRFILECASEKSWTDLSEMQRIVEASEEKRQMLIPSISIFKEIIIDLIRSETIDMDQLRIVRASSIVVEKEETLSFSDSLQIGEIFLALVERFPQWTSLKKMTIAKKPSGADVIFSDLPDVEEEGKSIVCTDIHFAIEREE